MEIKLPEPDREVILKRAARYYEMRIPDIMVFIRYAMDPYNMCQGDIRVAMGSDARHQNINALSKPECVILLIALTQPLYEAIKALKHEELPLLINHDWIYPDLKDFFTERLKNG